VTVKQYKQYCAATGKAMPPEPVYDNNHFNPNWSKEDHPMVNVNWNDATAYCRWLSQQTGLKVSLPTEAQWEKAARGEDGRKFPWGNTFDGSRLQHSTAKLGDAGGTAPVGSFPTGASPYGVLDMAGNVWQWCADWFDEKYYESSPKSNPTGPASGTFRVLRGGSWYYCSEIIFRCANRFRFAQRFGFNDYGFRCVVSAE
jgi:sulfatase modifying factor 1